MLTADVRVEEFDASDWIAIGDILGGRAPWQRDGLILVVDGARVVKLWSTARGRLEPQGIHADASLAALLEARGGAWATRLDRRVLPILCERFARRVEPLDDLSGQISKLAVTVRELAGEGLLESCPRDARELLPSVATIERALDVLCPVGKTLVLGAFEGGEVSTAFAAHRGPGGFDRIAGPATARTEMGMRSGDFTRDARGLARAYELSVGPLALGCFAEARTWKSLVADREPGAWAAAVAARELVFHPANVALSIPLAFDVGRVAAVAARELSARFGLSSWIERAGMLEPLSILRDLLSARPGNGGAKR